MQTKSLALLTARILKVMAVAGVALDSLTLGGDGKTVSLSFDLPSELFDVLSTTMSRGASHGASPSAPR